MELKEPSSISKKSTSPEFNPHSISILIPTKNSAKLLREVLASIGNLDYDKEFLETIVIDALSTDSTVSIAEEFGTTVMSFPGNVPSSYNFVLGRCRGDLVAFADSDAKVEKSWLKTLVERLDEEELHVVGVGGNSMTWNSDRLLPRLIGYEQALRYSSMGESNPHFPTMNVLFKKQALLDIGGFNEKLVVGCDVDIGLRLTAAGKLIAYEPTAIVYHFQRDNLKAYANQQFVTGKNVPVLLVDNKFRIGGSKIDTPSMYAEPVMLSIALVSILVGIVASPLLLVIGGIVGFGLACIIAMRTVEIALLQRRPDSILMPALFIIRLVCWCLGAAAFLVGGRSSRSVR